MLAWSPKRGVPAEQEPLPIEEEGRENYHRDICTGLRLREEGARKGGLEEKKRTDHSHAMRRHPD